MNLFAIYVYKIGVLPSLLQGADVVRKGMAGKGNIIVGQSLIRCGLWVRALWCSYFKHDFIKQSCGPLLLGIFLLFFFPSKCSFSFQLFWLCKGLQCLRPQFSNFTSRGEQNRLWVNRFKHKQAQTIRTKYVWILPHASAPLNHVLRPQTWLGFRSYRAWGISQGLWCFVRQELLPFLDTLQTKVSLHGAGV